MALQSKLGKALAALALGASAAGCVKGHHHGGGGGGHPSVFSFVEHEPNDFAAAANYFGTLAIGETLIVHGAIDDSGYDPFDGFAFTTVEPLDVEFYLTSDNPGADLDLCYFNPYTGLEEACWETGYNPEAGLLSLNGGRDFHLVVASYYGASSYTLEIIARPIGYAPAAAAPEPQAAPRARARPFADYGGAGLAAVAAEEAQPAVRGRLIAVDPTDGSVVTRDFELGPGGARLGPALRRSPAQGS